MSQLEKIIFEAIAGKKNRSLKESSHPEIHRLLRPFGNATYPLNQIFDFSRVQSQSGWVNSEKIMEILSKNPAIAKEMRTKKGKEKVKKIAEESIEYRGYLAYGEEWANQTEEQVREVVSASGGAPEKANNTNAEEVAKEIRKQLRKRKTVTIMDVGLGGGGTIIPVIEKLSPEEKSRVHIVLLDIMGGGLKRAKRALTGKSVDVFEQGKFIKKRPMKDPLKSTQITTFNSNFFDLVLLDKKRIVPSGYNTRRLKKLRRLTGKVDVLTSGAALHHTRNTESLFKGLYQLVRKGGFFHHFDWGHYARSSRKIALHSKEMQQKIPVSHGDSPRKADTVFAMNQTWMNLFWLHPKAGEIIRKAMLKAQREGKEFDFISWVVKNRKTLKKLKIGKKFLDAKITKAIPPFCMEGHEPLPERVEAMKKAGFRVSRHHTPFYNPKKPHGVESLLYLVNARKPRIQKPKKKIQLRRK